MDDLRGLGCKFALIAGVMAMSLSVMAAQPPRLVLQITVDALRGDLPLRHLSKMGKGGFRYLIDHGVFYTSAHYQHGNTETIVGHSSLATGTIPAIHGMVGNLWFDRHAGHLVYNVEDSRYHLLDKDADVDKASEIDPTQRAATVDGRSPRAILSSTFSDELAAAYGNQSRVFAVSVKDRGAIPLAGKMGRHSGSPRPPVNSLPATTITMPTRNGCSTGTCASLRQTMAARRGS